MNAERLLRHYERIADAPDAVSRLRRFILDLAVRGKLVPQDPCDEPASELLERVVKENHKRAERAIKKTPLGITVPIEDCPFGAPQGWSFVRLGAVLEMMNGRAFKPSDWIRSGLPIVRIQNLNNANADFNFCDPKTVDDRHLIRDGEFLISWSGTPGTSFGAFIWSRGLAALNQHIFRCIQIGDPFFPEFLRLAINSQLDVLIGQAQGGVGLQHVTKGTLEALALPLPPFPEQHRIVAKVDEMMALYDRLEAARTRREEARDKLAAASFARLNAPDPETFHDDARFVLEALPALTARPDQIKQLRQTILNLAVRGKLVPQDPSDEPASELLKRLTKLQAVAFSQENLRARPPITRLSRNELWFGIPEGWAVAAFDDLFVIVSGVTKGQMVPRHEAIEVPYLRVANVQRGYLDLAQIKTITVRRADEERYALRSGDILMTEGGDWDKLGRAAVWREEVGHCIHQNHVFRVRPPSDEVLPEWVTMFVNSALGRAYFENASKQTTNLASINMSQLRGCPLPLPPVAEQHRIVAKVDELMALCDRLETRLATGDDNRRRLLDALLAEALASTGLALAA